MNKRELITRVQRHMGAGASRDAAQAAVNAVLSSVLQAAAEGNKVHLAQLGSFEYRAHRMRSGAGLPDTVPQAPRTVQRLNFHPSKRLKERSTQ